MDFKILLFKSKDFKKKSAGIQTLISTTLELLTLLGLPIEQTARRLERMCITFLACINVKELSDFPNLKALNDKYALKTREVIEFVNQNFGENISSGSYDDIRRKDLKLLVLAGIILQSSPEAATNDSTRGYGLSPGYKSALKVVGKPKWQGKIKVFNKSKPNLALILKRKRNIAQIPVILPDGKKLNFSLGEHNVLQKKIIEDFLPIYGYNARVLYVGDTSDKYLFVDEGYLEKLNIFQIAHEELPDIIAYSEEKRWLYFIEAVHSSGPISETRLLTLKKITKECKVDIVYVTAFLAKKDFRKFTAEIAWETEVWVAESPEHMIHFNGDKFLGPY